MRLNEPKPCSGRVSVEPFKLNVMKTKKDLVTVQKLRKAINKLEKQCPQKPLWFAPRKKGVDIEKSDPKIIAQINELISEKWELEHAIGNELNVKKGDEILYLDGKTDAIKTATVLYMGKSKNDYEDFSDFVRIRNATHSWYQPKDSIVKI